MISAPASQRGLRDLRFLRVDGNGNLQESAQSPKHWQEPLQLFFGGNSLRARPRGLRADIDQVGACAFHV